MFDEVVYPNRILICSMAKPIMETIKLLMVSHDYLDSEFTRNFAIFQPKINKYIQCMHLSANTNFT